MTSDEMPNASSPAGAETAPVSRLLRTPTMYSSAMSTPTTARLCSSLKDLFPDRRHGILGSERPHTG